MDVKEAATAVADRMRRVPTGRVDAVVATALVAAALVTTSGTSAEREPRDALGLALVLAATLPFYARRRWPLPVFMVSAAAVAAVFVRGQSPGILAMVGLVAAYTVGAHCPAREVVFAAVYLDAAFVVMVAADSPDFGGAAFVTSVAVYGATMLVGWTAQQRRQRLEALEREQGEAARRAATDERLRIAQELHDVVAHSLGVIAVQAGVGMHMIDNDPAEAKRALEHISRTSRTSLAEIRRLLGLVRRGEPASAYAPAPGLADLPRLAREVADAGLPVDLDVAGGAGLPPGVELAAYRIVQEALTNALRHARARRATVRLAVDAGRVRVVVSDDGAGPDGGRRAGGHGLVGMRERVAVYGGTLAAGPAPGGGFRVDATIPYDEEPM